MAKKDKQQTPIEKEYATVHPSKDHNLGKPITKEEVVKGWDKPIMLSKGYVTLVGGVAIHGESTGDIDILLKKTKPKDPTEDIPLIFRLHRAQPSGIANRLQFIYTEKSGAFTTHKEIYDLVLVPSNSNAIQMSETKIEEEHQANYSDINEAETYRFGVQHHYRPGKTQDTTSRRAQEEREVSSLHCDFRYETNTKLTGYTWADQVIGEVPQVNTLKEAKEADKKTEAFKINWNTGQFKETTTKAGHEVKKEIYAVQKETYTLPKTERTRILLDLEGVYPPSTSGISTKFGPGIFTQIDSGVIEYGVIRDDFKEYFLQGKKLKGRLIHRKLPKGTYKRVGEDKYFWVAIQPIDQEPYIISSRAESKGYITPQNISALPKKIKKNIPEEYKYWKHGSGKRRVEIRNKLRYAIQRGKVKIE